MQIALGFTSFIFAIVLFLLFEIISARMFSYHFVNFKPILDLFFNNSLF